MTLSACWILLVLPCLQELSEEDKRVDELIEKLKTHSVESTAAAFLKRPELSRLMARGPAAFPRLKHHFLTSEDPRIQASAGFLAILHAQNSDSEFVPRCEALSDSPNAMVRAVAKSRLAEMRARCVLEVPDWDPDEKNVVDQIGFHTGLNWMSVGDLKTLVTNALQILKRGKVLIDPPVLWMIGGGTQRDPNPKRLRSSGVRMLTGIARMAELSVRRALDTARGHDVHDQVLQCVEADDGTDPSRLGLLIRLASEAAWHRHPAIDHTCELAPANRRRLFTVCEKWSWSVTDPNAQYGVLWGLDAVSLWKGYDLKERLSKDHPDEQVRELAGFDQNGYHNRLLEKGYTREMEKEEDERLKKSSASR